MEGRDPVRIKDVEVTTVKYEFNHGAKPRGFGSWAFCPRRHYGRNEAGNTFRVMQCNYGVAKRKAQEHFAALGEIWIVVLP